MKKQKSLALNFTMNIILTMSSFIFPLITFPYVSRILLPAGTGKVTFATSVISYFNILAQLGIPTYGIRVCAQVRDNREELSRTVHELFAINMIMSTCAYVLFLVSVVSVPRLHQERSLFLVISLSIWFNTIGMEWLYKALEQYTYITVRSVAFKLVALLSMFLLVHQESDYVYYGAVTILAASASNIFNFINVHRFISFHSVGSYNLKRHLKPVVIFFAMSCATTVYTNLDMVMLGFLKTDTEVGYYGAAVKVKTILLSIVTSLGTVLLPRVSYYIENGMKEEFHKIAEKALDFVALISIPMCMYFILFARESIFFLSGEAYTGAVLPMQIIMPTLILIGLTNIMGIQMLVPMGAEKYVLYSELAGAAANLVLNAILIPELASSGAALGTLAAEGVVWYVQYYFLKNEVGVMYRKIRYGLFVGGAVAGGIVASVMKMFHFHMVVTLIISAVIYFGIYILVLLAGKETLMLETEKKIRGFLKRL